MKFAIEAVPDGYAVEHKGNVVLIVVEELHGAAVDAGLDRADGWSSRVGGPPGSAGRAATAVIDLAGTPTRIKTLSRGGILGPVWRERFAGSKRLWANLVVPLEAVRRGVATPRPIALAIAGGPTGFYRGWLATEEVVGAMDLGRMCRSPEPPSEGELNVLVERVREMHDRGVDHPDLNLGNLLLRRGSGAAEGFIVDLDRTRLRDRPLAAGPRARALARLERSAIKLGRRFAEFDRSSRIADLFWSRYPAGDVALARRLAFERRWRRPGMAAHRLGGLR